MWVVDASVVIKWLLNDSSREGDTENATALMQSIVESRESIVQPVHWLPEVAGVLARLSPATAPDDVTMLRALELPVEDGPEVLQLACRLAIDLQQHVFDTLYHSVALNAGATLVTADERYLRAAKDRGGIVDLADWSSFSPP